MDSLAVDGLTTHYLRGFLVEVRASTGCFWARTRTRCGWATLSTLPTCKIALEELQGGRFRVASSAVLEALREAIDERLRKQH